MKNIKISAKLKKVGNSLAFFIPAEVKNKLHLEEDQELEAQLSKKKDAKALASLFGCLKGKKLKWKCESERIDRF